MRYFAPQVCQEDCGFAALKTLLTIISKKRAYLFLVPPKNSGYYNFLELRNYASAYGFCLEGRSFESICDIQEECPFILQVQNDQRKHFVVVRKIGKKNSIIYDPIAGKMKVSNEAINQMSLNNGLFFKKFIPEKKKIVPKIFFSLKTPIIVCDILLTVSLLLGFFFMNHDKYISYILLLGTGIFSVLHQLLIKKSMAKFDEMIIKNWQNLYKNAKDKLQKILMYKKIAYEKFFGILLSFLYIIVALVLLITNDYYSLIVALLILAVNICKFKICYPKLKKMETQLAKKENEVLVGLDNHIDKTQDLKIIFKQAYRIGMLYTVIEWIIKIIIAIAIVGQMLFSKSFYLNYFLFYFAYYSFLQTNISNYGKSFTNDFTERKLAIEVGNIVHKDSKIG